MLKVLVVDDSLVIRNKVSDILKYLGHEVVFNAINGKEAIKAYIKYKPDLVTMDINMSDINGIDALKYIKRINKNAKIIMVTSYGQEELVNKSIQEGAEGYILKPITNEKLKYIIEEIFPCYNKDLKAI